MPQVLLCSSQLQVIKTDMVECLTPTAAKSKNRQHFAVGAISVIRDI